MANPEFFKPAFDALATNGYIGDPQGRSAYCYLRVSTGGQAEEGRSGLPRQIEHIHEIAQARGYRVAWDMVFADDDSGFAFEYRPQLTALRAEYNSDERRGSAIIIEQLDRLSRHADWHQGYLLDEMRKAGVEVVFWKAYHSRVERAVMGAISQDAMEDEKRRMRDGTILKAKSGRLPVKRALYGYQLVDSRGNTGDTARKDTHYGIDEAVSPIIQFIYDQIAYQGATTAGLTTRLNALYPPPMKYRCWTQSFITRLIHNAAYKGEFIYNRTTTKYHPRTQPSRKGTMRPKAEVIPTSSDTWIVIPVPAIVSAEVWELANQNLGKNWKGARRNGRAEYLLTGLVYCAECGYSLNGGSYEWKARRTGQKRRIYRYRCSTYVLRSGVARPPCGQNHAVKRELLEDAVWATVCEVLTHPELLLRMVNERFNGHINAERRRHMEYIVSQLEEAATADARAYRAYEAGITDLEEFKDRRTALRERIKALKEELKRVKGQIMTPEQYEEQKNGLMALYQRAQEAGVMQDAPFEIRRRFTRILIDRIEVNIKENWFKVDGAYTGVFTIDNPLAR